jgi:hypothetical protein
MLGGAWKMSAVLEESKLSDLRWQFKRSPDEDHGTIAYLGTYEGLEAIFKGYRVADPVALFEQGDWRLSTGTTPRCPNAWDTPLRCPWKRMPGWSGSCRVAVALPKQRKSVRECWSGIRQTPIPFRCLQRSRVCRKICPGHPISDPGVATGSGKCASPGSADKLQSRRGQNCAEPTEVATLDQSRPPPSVCEVPDRATSARKEKRLAQTGILLFCYNLL